MISRFSSAAVRIAFAAGALVPLSQHASAQTPVESSAEARFQLDVHVPDAAIAALLPTGFTPNVATQGAAKDANLRVVFIDRVTINAPDGKPVGKTGSNRLVYLIAPVKDPAGANAQLVIGGLTEDPADAPGPFGVYLPATHAHDAALDVQQRDRARSSIRRTGYLPRRRGEHLELHIKYERGVANRANPTETKFYSAKKPGFYQISKDERVLDILKNVDDHSSRPREGVLVQGIGRQLRQVVRRHAEGTELGQYSLDQSFRPSTVGDDRRPRVRAHRPRRVQSRSDDRVPATIRICWRRTARPCSSMPASAIPIIWPRSSVRCPTATHRSQTVLVTHGHSRSRRRRSRASRRRIRGRSSRNTRGRRCSVRTAFNGGR